MLYNILFYLFICVISSKVCLCERRLTNGRAATDKKYVVYLVNSPYSDSQPEAWLCGGVLISTRHVLTAAACLTEVSHIYVIAGYKKYVSGKNILDDPCTATRKQKIVKVIIPTAYNESTWMRFDVGVGVVEKHYDFLDETYRKDCSYSPEAIPINYSMKLESPGDSVLSLGWGAALPRIPGMGAVNSEYLMETHVIIGNTSFCQLQFPKNFEYLFLCTYGFRDTETLEAIARIKLKKETTSSSTTKKTTRHIISSTTKTSTIRTQSELTNKRTTSFTRGTWRCGEDKQFDENNPPEECIDMVSDVEILRRKISVFNGSDTSSDEISNKNEPFKENKSDLNHIISRRQETDVENYGGICQNDHGGPLVALAGQQERLIGIALNSVYTENFQCDGPSLYISTARAKALIYCLLATKHETYYVPKRCKEMNFEVRKYNVSWPDCENDDCETTTWSTPLEPVEQPESVAREQPEFPAPMVQPEIYPPIHYNMGMPPLNPPSNLMMGLPYTPYVTLNQYYYPYLTQPPYKIGLQNYLKGMPRIPPNSNMGMLHIPSNLNMEQPYNPSNYKKEFPFNPSNYNKELPYNLENYNEEKNPPYAWS